MTIPPRAWVSDRPTNSEINLQIVFGDLPENMSLEASGEFPDKILASNRGGRELVPCARAIYIYLHPPDIRGVSGVRFLGRPPRCRGPNNTVAHIYQSRHILCMTPPNTDCNGYTNYETWLVALHVDNTKAYYFRIHDLIKSLKTKALPDDEIKGAVAEEYKTLVSEIVENRPADTPQMIADYLAHLVTSVDYFGLAADALEDVRE